MEIPFGPVIRTLLGCGWGNTTSSISHDPDAPFVMYQDASGWVATAVGPHARAKTLSRFSDSPHTMGPGAMRMRVLVVEDERRLARLVRRVLEEERYTVDTAHDGVEGETLAREGSYDAIVLDLMLPGQDGVAVCRALRRDRI